MLENYSHLFLKHLIDKSLCYSNQITLISYFKLEVSETIKNSMEEKIIDRNNQSYGELFNVRFVKIEDILQLNNLNRQTTCAITELMKLI